MTRPTTLVRNIAAAAALAGLLTARADAAPKYRITVLGGDEASFAPASAGPAARDPGRYDAVVVGGGLAGLTASLYLSDQGKSVLLLEKEPNLGGLAFGGSTHEGIRYDRGAAYWTDAYEEEREILKHLGMGDYREKDAIHEPSDSYLWEGRLYLGLWEAETLKELPASFELFKYELLMADKEKYIPNQPIEESEKLDLDLVSAAQWVRSMPERVRRRASADPEAERIYKRFLSDRTVPGSDPMAGVLGLLDIYCRSALGAPTDRLSGVAFANFYISEIVTRYTTTIGTGNAAERLEETLKARSGLVTIKTRAPATRISELGGGVRVAYLQDGSAREAEAGYAVYAAQLKFAPRIIEGLSEREPERAGLLSGLEYAHFSVHAAFVKGHPYRATYDTWVRAADYTEDDFTDVILGRWMDPKIRGYEGLRDFKTDPPDDAGILTLYHPLPKKWLGKGYTRGQAEKLAERAVDRMLKLFAPALKSRWGTRIEIESVETTRWPYSLHVARPGHFRNGRLLRRPFGRVFFAHSNLGTPAFEEALFRGHCAADNILAREVPGFQYEPWSRCPKP